MAYPDCESVIIYTVKTAKDNDGIIVRLYETEGSHANCRLLNGSKYARVFETDMLENSIREITQSGKAVCLQFSPFKIKTLKFSN